MCCALLRDFDGSSLNDQQRFHRNGVWISGMWRPFNTLSPGAPTYASMNWANSGTGKGLSTARRQVITWRDATSSSGPFRANFGEIPIKTRWCILIKKMYLKMYTEQRESISHHKLGIWFRILSYCVGCHMCYSNDCQMCGVIHIRFISQEVKHS